MGGPVNGGARYRRTSRLRRCPMRQIMLSIRLRPPEMVELLCTSTICGDLVLRDRTSYERLHLGFDCTAKLWIIPKKAQPCRVATSSSAGPTTEFPGRWKSLEVGVLLIRSSCRFSPFCGSQKKRCFHNMKRRTQ